MIVLKWSRVQLLKYRDVGLEFDEVLNLEYLKERDSQILGISPIRVKGRADIAATKVTFHLTITGELILPSSRTLREVKFPLEIHTTETFLFDADEEYLPDADSHIVEGDMINLIPVLEELILLEIPLQVYNEEDDLIPDSQLSGKDWDLILDEESWRKEKIDPRLSKLANLLKNDEE
mgnify:FL=1